MLLSEANIDNIKGVNIIENNYKRFGYVNGIHKSNGYFGDNDIICIRCNDNNNIIIPHKLANNFKIDFRMLISYNRDRIGNMFYPNRVKEYLRDCEIIVSLYDCGKLYLLYKKENKLYYLEERYLRASWEPKETSYEEIDLQKITSNVLKLHIQNVLKHKTDIGNI